MRLSKHQGFFHRGEIRHSSYKSWSIVPMSWCIYSESKMCCLYMDCCIVRCERRFWSCRHSFRHTSWDMLSHKHTGLLCILFPKNRGCCKLHNVSSRVVYLHIDGHKPYMSMSTEVFHSILVYISRCLYSLRSFGKVSDMSLVYILGEHYTKDCPSCCRFVRHSHRLCCCRFPFGV